ncbi:tRNA guanosine(34) transglycosylase Tgt [Lepagella muris]|jgi:queuine tRNA-ribosyltransferase|uniref:tRNA guanosine(34) transglycosylase Tgt n=1 Tax=Lepagella muris TaxID=3032870 RepID=A0AC61RK27_9BACT|nr:tRNA guanosine(34) transglycosylase Tgt [Lepagella muris]ROT06116.1 tRNA guanosine(34) transglycosylase Tgt [Muribaculaceae bacterium Isolate-037 (Harlan)]TGY80488.1 tRNA guanosine(34) transglycosylase Tgt [Lepagella muris]THG53386.1 tRNA guanosine(34) transglycosylase Tgt [Bacteroidales bacterium]TKC61619.1 tRNA guanosine(34) transglycosylase Tgt [Bacteroidales bacterium]
MDFKIEATAPHTNARAGEITTDHGKIPTPIFMPVGTVGSVKAVHMRELRDDIDAKIILGNTYHLYLRPGLDILRNAGGLHKFNGWERPILTDSGGFQVFSLSSNRKLKEEGAWFRSHIDGSKHLFTPEGVVDIQRVIGADIMMALDECTPGTADLDYAKKSLALTQRWLERGWKRYKETEGLYGYRQAYFPIVQGCVYPELRREAAKHIADLGAEGNAIGGLAVGEPTEKMYEMIEVVNDILPTDKPRYLMGVGTPANILEAIDRGVDMMDCVMPTRNGRNGMLFTRNGIMNMRNKKWADDYSPLDEGGAAWVDEVYSKAYVRHLFVSQELLAMQIASVHNLAFYLWLVKEARRHIIAGDFKSWKTEMVERVTRRL